MIAFIIATSSLSIAFCLIGIDNRLKQIAKALENK